MNPYALLSLISSVLCVALGFFTLYNQKKKDLTILFFSVLILNAYWAFCEFMMRQTETLETAIVWSKALSFTPFLFAVLVHFALVFSESKTIKIKLTCTALYGSALFFSLIDLTTDWICATPVLKPWVTVMLFQHPYCRKH